MSENERPVSPIDALYDEENTDVILLYNEHGEPVAFEQVAVIPREGKVYAILKPVRPMEGVGEDEAFVLSVEVDENGEEYLALTTDEEIIDEVFDVYNALIEAQNED